jgi:hypothetical protein
LASTHAACSSYSPWAHVEPNGGHRPFAMRVSAGLGADDAAGADDFDASLQLTMPRAHARARATALRTMASVYDPGRSRSLGRRARIPRVEPESSGHPACRHRTMRLQFFSRAAAWRLLALFVVLGGATLWCWVTMIRMPGKSHAGPLAPLDAREESLQGALRADVAALASTIGPRNVLASREMAAAADHVEAAFAAAGYAARRQTFRASGVACDNVEAELAGTDRKDDIVIVGAHYDSTFDMPGANDNASGTAALLALARAFAGRAPRATLRFVAFANEEPPHFQTEGMGSLVYARRCKERGERVVAMLSLETIGYYTDARGSQQYPPPLSLFYPSTGDFIGFVGDRSSVDLVRRCIGTFRATTAFPSEGAALPSFLPGVGWSDHWSFWQFGYPGVMVTDTAPFRYPHYHSIDDTPEKLDYARMARVVAGVERVVAELAGAR